MSTPTEAPPAPAQDAPAPPAQQAPPAPAAPEPPQPPAQPAPPVQQPAAPQPTAPVPAPPSPPAPAEGTTELERVTAERDRWKAQARAQEQRSKANHTEVKSQQAVLKLIADKVGVEYDDRPDPEELTRRLEEKTAQATQRTVELAIYTTAAQMTGLSASALLDSREFMARTGQLDPDAADFPSLVADLVREASSQPRYQTAPPPAQAQQPAPLTQPAGQQAPAQPPAPLPPAPASGSDFSGAPGGNRLWTEADYEYWTAPGRDRDGTVITEAIQKGLLVNLGVGKPRTRSRR